MLTGTLDDFTLPDVFRLMSFAKKTGRLDVVRSAGQGKVFFREGEVYFAESSLSKEPLGQKLVRARAITDGQLMKALDEHAASGKRLGEVLIESGLVTTDQIESVLQQQIEDAIFDLLRWELGEFAWEPGDQLDVEVHIGVSVENLIMEASRRLDEFEVIKRKIPSGAAILGMAATPPEGAVEINITPEEWRILVLVDGTRSVNDIAGMVGLDEFGAMRVLYGLVSAGLIELISDDDAGRPAAVDTPLETATEAPVAEAVEEEPEPADEPVAEVVEFEPEVVAEADDVEVEIQADATDPATDIATDTAPDDVSVAEFEDIQPYTEEGQQDEATVEEIETVAAAEENGAQLTEDADFASFGIVGDEATPDQVAWSEPAVDSFDAPQPDELVTLTPETDPFVSELFAEGAIPPASDEPPAPPEAPVEEEIPVSSAPAGEAPAVDRAAVVRELAGLFNDEDRPRARPSAPRSKESDAQDDARKRVEDDDQVTKGIISRLIDGVKGL
jgi:Domain of unknown function (DUF4388)